VARPDVLRPPYLDRVRLTQGAFHERASGCVLPPRLAAPRDPSLANGTGKTIVRKLAAGNDISMVVISRAGTALFLDPRSTRVVPDVVAVTHDHHLDKEYVTLAREAKVIVQQPGVTTVKDVKVTGIAASHTERPVKSPPEYVLYLVEVDGLRIAFFPCMGQVAFTPEQLAALGKVDVAMIGVDANVNGRGAKRAYSLARTIQPKIVIPLSHHYTDYEMALDDITDAGGKVQTVKDPLLLDAASLRGPERVLNLVAPSPG
jgi:hypothetical protein